VPCGRAAFGGVRVVVRRGKWPLAIRGTAVQEGTLEPERFGLRLRHAPLIFTHPLRLFGRVEDTGAYGWALLTLLVLVMSIGYLQVQTGLIDRIVDQRTEENLARIEKEQAHLVDRVQLKETMETARKSGEFLKKLTHLQAVALKPLYLLASFLLTASVLYAMVALTGRKPEYHTLMSICVHAGFILLVMHVLEFAMMVAYRRTDVNTSLKTLAEGPAAAVLAGVNPFKFWYWILVAAGVTVTRQLSRRMAVVTCVLLCVVSSAIPVLMELAAQGVFHSTKSV